MITIPIRDLQQRGTAAISKGATGPMLITGRPGALFYLIPADPNHLAEQEAELRRAMARADLRSWQARAIANGLSKLSDAEIQEEIAEVRRDRRVKSKAGVRSRRSTRS